MMSSGTGQDLTVEQVRSVVERAYMYRHSGVSNSVLMIGPHGVGKSTIVKQIALDISSNPNKYGLSGERKFTEVSYSQSKLIDITRVKSAMDNYFLYFDFRLTEVEPQDLAGLPSISNEETLYNPPIWAKALSLPNAAGILFLDELTNVQRLDVISAVYKLLLDKAAGYTKFSSDVMVIAAGNPMEEGQGSIAQTLPRPLINRVLMLGVKAPTLQEWIAYMDRMYPGQWDRRVIDFFSSEQAAMACKQSPSTMYPPCYMLLESNREVYENEPTPRTWTYVALMLPKLNDNDMKPFLIGYLGRVAGSALYTFLTTTSVDINRILNGDMQYFMSLNAQQKNEVMGTLANMWIQNRQQNQILDFMAQLQSSSMVNARALVDYFLNVMRTVNPDAVKKFESMLIKKRGNQFLV